MAGQSPLSLGTEPEGVGPEGMGGAASTWEEEEETVFC